MPDCSYDTKKRSIEAKVFKADQIGSTAEKHVFGKDTTFMELFFREVKRPTFGRRQAWNSLRAIIDGKVTEKRRNLIKTIAVQLDVIKTVNQHLELSDDVVENAATDDLKALGVFEELKTDDALFSDK